MDWFHHIIGPDKPQILWWQECIRALLIFVFGLVLIRLFGRRAFGRQNALDIIFAIIRPYSAHRDPRLYRGRRR